MLPSLLNSMLSLHIFPPTIFCTNSYFITSIVGHFLDTLSSARSNRGASRLMSLWSSSVFIMNWVLFHVFRDVSSLSSVPLVLTPLLLFDLSTVSTYSSVGRLVSWPVFYPTYGCFPLTLIPLFLFLFSNPYNFLKYTRVEFLSSDISRWSQHLFRSNPSDRALVLSHYLWLVSCFVTSIW